MKKELKSGILSADKSADGRPTVGGVNVITVLASVLKLPAALPSTTGLCRRNNQLFFLSDN